jgi:hypothetical protein
MIQIRVSPDELAHLEGLAGEVPLSTWIRNRLLEPRNLYEVAQKVTLEAGLPYHHPVTGKTTEPYSGRFLVTKHAIIPAPADPADEPWSCAHCGGMNRHLPGCPELSKGA